MRIERFGWAKFIISKKQKVWKLRLHVALQFMSNNEQMNCMQTEIKLVTFTSCLDSTPASTNHTLGTVKKSFKIDDLLFYRIRYVQSSEQCNIRFYKKKRFGVFLVIRVTWKNSIFRIWTHSIQDLINII